MNLEKLFKTQAQLDEHIYIKHPELRGQDNLDWKLLALQVELGECANEWRGFKKWSMDQEPRTYTPNPNDPCKACGGQGYTDMHLDTKEWKFCEVCDGCGVYYHNPLLEEYVDCLHFILSIGIDLQIHYDYNVCFNKDDEEPTIDLFAECYAFASDLYWNFKNGATVAVSQNDYGSLLIHFNQLGGRLGFSWEEIETAYYAKNKINHERQESGY